MNDLPTQNRTTATIWRYLSSPDVVRVALHSMPNFTSIQPRWASFSYTSSILDRSLCVESLSLRDDRVIYHYRIELFHLSKDIIVICSKREIAESIRATYLAKLAIITVEMDIEKLVRSNQDWVTRLYVHLENNPALHAVAFYGNDVLRSHLYHEMGAATYLSATLTGGFDTPPDTQLSFNTDGSFSANNVLNKEQKIAIAEKLITNYERKNG